jgi:hypothetical protein
VALVATVAACGSTAQQSLASSPSSSATLIAQSPAPRSEPHVMVIMDENRGVAATLGHCSSDP